MSEHIRAADHAMGLELQLEELVEQRRRAVTQGRHDDAAGIAAEIAELQSELAVTAETAASGRPESDAGPVIHAAAQLDVQGEPT